MLFPNRLFDRFSEEIEKKHVNEKMPPITVQELECKKLPELAVGQAVVAQGEVLENVLQTGSIISSVNLDDDENDQIQCEQQDRHGPRGSVPRSRTAHVRTVFEHLG